MIAFSGIHQNKLGIFTLLTYFFTYFCACNFKLRQIMTNIILAQASSQIDSNLKLAIVIGSLFFIALITTIYRAFFKKGKGGSNGKGDSTSKESDEIKIELPNKSSDNNDIEQPVIQIPNTTIIEQPTTIKEDIKEEIPPVINDPEIEEPKTGPSSKPKHIGYNPINIFAQTEPLNYPYVIMPKKTDCVIKFPRKGRNGRKGYKEDAFYGYLGTYFNGSFKLYNDRFVLSRNNANRYEPDFTLINEEKGINIFMDIEIDEPYEGLNDVHQRSVTHCQYFDTNRNNEFASRGWIVIRFAEIQVHKNPDGCCRFIADVIRSIDSDFQYPANLLNANKVEPIRQWTKEVARQWSVQKYREQYLGIDSFGSTADAISSSLPEATEEEKEVEKEVVDEKPIITPKPIEIILSKPDMIKAAIHSSKYLAFKYNDSRTIVKPIEYTDSILIAFCYVKNKNLSFSIVGMTDICVKENYYTHRFVSPSLGMQKVADIMNIVIPNQIFVRMKYTRGAWTSADIDPETGEIIINRTEAEESIRTVSNIKLDVEGWGNNYIRTYCHKREDERTFRFDRISELELLDL